MFLVFISLLKILSLTIPMLLAVAYFTVAERKIMGAIQRRKGPNVIGFVGLLQALADGLKLFTKETTLPSNSNLALFILAPVLSFLLSVIAWGVIPFSHKIVFVDVSLGVLYLFVVSSMNVYGIILAGWSSNSKYAFLGGLRSAAQMVSYEISIGFILLNIGVSAGSLNLNKIILAQNEIWLIIPLFPLFVMFYISMLAETNRQPFDLPEAESELVSGYNVEYSAMTFALFFLAEYSNMLLMSSLASVLFLGGWLSPFNIFPGSFWFSIKVCLGAFFFIISRATLPRYRYDQLMYLGWKCFLPFTIGYLMFLIGLLISFNFLPY